MEYLKEFKLEVFFELLSEWEVQSDSLASLHLWFDLSGTVCCSVHDLMAYDKSAFLLLLQVQLK